MNVKKDKSNTVFMTPFKAKICAEGTRRNLRITIPAAIADQLRETGFHPPGWTRLHVTERPPVFAVARFPLSRPSVTCTLPAWAFGDLKPGTTIEARIEDAVPYRARANTQEGFDWLPFVDADYLATDDGEDLIIHSRHEEPFRLKRFPTPTTIAALRTLVPQHGRDFTIARTLDNVRATLENAGIARARVRIQNGVLRVHRSAPLVRLIRKLKREKPPGG